MMGILIYFMISCSKIVLSLLHENESIYHFFFMSYSRQHSIISILLVSLSFVWAVDSCSKLDKEELDAPSSPLSSKTIVLNDDIDKGLLSSAVSGTLIKLSNGLVLEKKDTCYYLDGDMRYTIDELAKLSKASTEKNISRSTSSFPNYWPSRKVYYSFDSGCSSLFQSNAIQAMNNISLVCGVRFIPATSQQNRIVFKNVSTNDSQVGMVGGNQIININNYDNIGVITHELLHSLGFHHEHSRMDRDNYLIIYFSNIVSSKWFAFDKYSNGICNTALDYNSIMIYPSFISDSSFSINPSLPVLAKVSGGYVNYNTSLSALDIQDLKNIYGPPYHRIETTSTVITDYYDYGTEIYEEEVVFTIHFYSDETFTTATSLTEPRDIWIRKTTTYCDVFQQLYSNSIEYLVTVPAGSSSYQVGCHNNYEYYAYGSPSHVDIENYYIVNSH